jgi:hypothetical protein
VAALEPWRAQWALTRSTDGEPMRLVLVAALVVSSLSFAQTSETREKKQTTVIFDENDVINGELNGPEGTVVYGKPRPKFPPMIRVRRDFSDKLMQSVSELH